MKKLNLSFIAIIGCTVLANIQADENPDFHKRNSEQETERQDFYQKDKEKKIARLIRQEKSCSLMTTILMPFYFGAMRSDDRKSMAYVFGLLSMMTNLGNFQANFELLQLDPDRRDGSSIALSCLPAGLNLIYLFDSVKGVYGDKHKDKDYSWIPGATAAAIITILKNMHDFVN